jgi:hypothetical protein
MLARVIKYSQVLKRQFHHCLDLDPYRSMNETISNIKIQHSIPITTRLEIKSCVMNGKQFEQCALKLSYLDLLLNKLMMVIISTRLSTFLENGAI